MKEVTKDMIIGDMLAQDMSIAAILMNAGMPRPKDVPTERN